ncbi:MAG: leucyl aminopeptidase [Bacteroidia bacterium]|nr:leucyl aminopeptidase [Bacteroidia bacterium]
MEVKFTNKIKKDPKILLGLLITDESAPLFKEILPKPFYKAIDWDSELLKKEDTLQHITDSEKILGIGLGKLETLTYEKLRKSLHTLFTRANALKCSQVTVFFPGAATFSTPNKLARVLGEMPFLSNYQYLKYFSNANEKKNTVEKVSYFMDGNKSLSSEDATTGFLEGIAIGKATCTARDLVNDPPNQLTATTLATIATQLGKTSGFSVEVLEKTKIEALKMGGLLSVNRGSIQPPTFSILEWKPKNPVNTQPIILVGKGVTFDTGGLSLKPTPNSMDSMKCDMAGAATVIATLSACAEIKIPLHIIGLVPATDNRPGEDAYTPNDVICMYNQTTVEVLNTDAEGRLILADALAYAKQYNPKLVIDLATLTGAAVVAVGVQGIAMMTNASKNIKEALLKAGEESYERLVELPLWDEYKELIKSDIADIKNIGGPYAGAITAGKFLEHFTSYPWVHLDIAGPAYLNAQDNYRPKNGTGTGVRLLMQFLLDHATEPRNN